MYQKTYLLACILLIQMATGIMSCAKRVQNHSLYQLTAKKYMWRDLNSPDVDCWIASEKNDNLKFLQTLLTISPEIA